MTDLEKCRDLIDRIDSEIINLYEMRMDVIKAVAEYKIANNMEVFDASREAKMLEKNLNKISNPEYKQYYEEVLKGFLSASKEMQKKLIESK